MSIQITEAMVQDYRAGVDLNYQQMPSRFRGHVDQEPVGPGKNAYFDRVGSTFATIATTRHEPTQYTDTPHFRRMCPIDTHRVADLIDDDDKLSVLNDPTNSYSRAFGASMNRQYDDTVIANALSVAATGETGSGSSGVPNAVTAAGVTVTLDELLGVKQRMDTSEVPDEGRHFVMHAYGFRQLLNMTEATSSDYASVKALVHGEINTFLGFTWHRSERLLLSGNDTRCFAWHMDALKVGMVRNVTARIDVMPNLNYSTQIYYAMRFGCVRMEEEGVEELKISTSGS